MLRPRWRARATARPSEQEFLLPGGTDGTERSVDDEVAAAALADRARPVRLRRRPHPEPRSATRSRRSRCSPTSTARWCARCTTSTSPARTTGCCTSTRALRHPRRPLRTARAALPETRGASTLGYLEAFRRTVAARLDTVDHWVFASQSAADYFLRVYDVEPESHRHHRARLGHRPRPRCARPDESLHLRRAAAGRVRRARLGQEGPRRGQPAGREPGGNRHRDPPLRRARGEAASPRAPRARRLRQRAAPRAAASGRDPGRAAPRPLRRDVRARDDRVAGRRPPGHRRPLRRARRAHPPARMRAGRSTPKTSTGRVELIVQPRSMPVEVLRATRRARGSRAAYCRRDRVALRRAVPDQRRCQANINQGRGRCGREGTPSARAQGDGERQPTAPSTGDRDAEANDEGGRNARADEQCHQEGPASHHASPQARVGRSCGELAPRSIAAASSGRPRPRAAR